MSTDTIKIPLVYDEFFHHIVSFSNKIMNDTYEIKRYKMILYSVFCI
ncbi:hypothetical protein BMW23_0426 [Bodo saltans virus]|uniref:Uncharacterized protein n=1 Tax=Bodo saltans virus TaxID=2024608 RepID=A0A2H4UU91_9VIRU|nr:hypothetical protein QJ851_gp0415 [Bodo saltans virus]ATZ80478.1 hypothetical protein BMW23_0426 [Bodo saltans virus]